MTSVKTLVDKALLLKKQTDPCDWATKRPKENNFGLKCTSSEWMIPYIGHPFFIWIMGAIFLIPFLFLNTLYLICKRFPPWSWDWRMCAPSDEHMEGFVDDVFKACDKVEEELGPADPEGKTKGKVYPAVSCNGVGHKSTRYFGLYYYLIKHDLIDRNTHCYAYSMASLVISCCYVCVRPSTKEGRLKALRDMILMWMQYGMEFLPNFPLHFSLDAMVGRVFSSMKKSIHKVMAENNLDRNKEKPDHLHIVVTRVFDLEKPGWVVSDWESYEDLVETCKASCSFPWQQEFYPWIKVKGIPCIDGGCSMVEMLPDQGIPEFTPCMHGQVGPLEAASIYGYTDPIRLALLDTFRLGLPMFRAKDYAADIAEGYRMAHRIHKSHIEALAALKPKKQ